MQLFRRILVLLVLFWPAVVTAQPIGDRPNIIFILADDLGYGDLGCYGQKQIRTPNLDRLAAEGIRFTQCYAGSTVCAPSRCCLMTGLHSGHALVRGNDRVPLRPQDVTVGKVLKDAGYRTGIIGKWGLGEPETTGIPNRQGFDYWFGFLNQHHAHNYYPDYLWKNETRVAYPSNVQKAENIAATCNVYAPDVFTREALQFVGSRRKEPFFLYLAYTLPHANNERGRAEGNGMEVPDDAPYSDKPWPQPQKNHAAMITRLDSDVGQLLYRLQALGLDDKTIIFFSSDNGPHKEGGGDPQFFRSAGPLRGQKRDLYEGGIRVPMIVRWPGRIKPGVSEFVWWFPDVLPTLAELGGGKAPEELDGRSIVPTLLGKSRQKSSDALYWEFHEGGSKQAVRMGDWKGIRLKVGGSLELYNLKDDPAETRNVAADHPEVVAKMEAYLKTARTESERWPLRPPIPRKKA